MIRRCGGQLRAGPNGAFGLDFGAVLAFGRAYGADPGLLADLLPDVEGAIVAGLQADRED